LVSILNVEQTAMPVPRVPSSLPPKPAVHFEEISVVTSILGGGSLANTPDPLVPFRASSIRGHLRFWWRATRGAAFATTEALHAAESAIWGSTEKASPISIWTDKLRLSSPVPALVIRHVNGKKERDYLQPQYALFPAQQTDIRNICKAGEFRLHFSVPPQLQDDFDAALHHWISFGGYGARTRRGLGSLFNPVYSGLERRYNTQQLLGDGSRRAWPTLKGSRLVIGGQTMPHTQAWEAAIKALSDFRQQRTRKMGRSLFPEPDEIRRLRNEYAIDHPTPINVDGDFPRAKFGLPIIFEFRRDGDRSGDPTKNTLVIDKDRDRFASPIIVKAMSVSKTHSRPIALFLNTAGVPETLTLTANNREDVKVQRGPRPVLSQFLAFAKNEWNGTEETL
jgi:CRISPR-associated protein Cmr1